MTIKQAILNQILIATQSEQKLKPKKLKQLKVAKSKKTVQDVISTFQFRTQQEK